MSYTLFMTKKAANPKPIPLIYRIPKDLHLKVKDAARKQDRSLNNMLNVLVRLGLEAASGR